MWRHLGVDVLAVSGSSLPALRRMRGRFNLSQHLLSDPDLDMAGTYTGTEDHDEHGEILRPATFIVDTDGVVRYEHLGEHPGDRTYANKTRAAIRHYDCRNPYE